MLLVDILFSAPLRPRDEEHAILLKDLRTLDDPYSQDGGTVAVDDKMSIEFANAQNARNHPLFNTWIFHIIISVCQTIHQEQLALFLPDLCR